MLLVIDTETSDLLKRDVPLHDPSQPWCVAVAAQLCDGDGLALDFIHARIRSDGRQVRPGAERIHGISSRAAARSGISEVVALGVLCGFAAQAEYLIGHGVSFDRQIVESLLLRRGKDTKLWVRPGLSEICTMKTATALCRIPSGRDDNQFKWPSLDEACETILGEPRREGYHSAYDDCDRARRLFLALRERNCVEVAA